MFVAIAGAFSERELIKAKLDAADVRKPRYQVVASWLDSKEQDADLTDVRRTYWATTCFREIKGADVLVYFPSDVPGIGRHREIGYAIGLGKRVVMVGSRTDHPHDHHTHIQACDLGDLRRTLDGIRSTAF